MKLAKYVAIFVWWSAVEWLDFFCALAVAFADAICMRDGAWCQRHLRWCGPRWSAKQRAEYAVRRELVRGR